MAPLQPLAVAAAYRQEPAHPTEPAWIIGDRASGTAARAKLRSLGQSFLRRSRLALLTVVVLNAVAIAAVGQLKPRFTAEADLIVGPREEQVVDLKAVLSGLSGDSDVIESEIQVLRSRDIARSIVQRFKLDHRAQFNPSLQPPGLLAGVADFAGAQYAALLKLVSPHAAPPARVHAAEPGLLPLTQAQQPDLSTDPLSMPRDPLSVPVDSFLQDLDVAAKGRSRVIGVSFTSTSPVLAAGLANAVADAYIANQLKAKTDATIQAHVWLDQRVTELRQQTVDADTAVAAYRRKTGLVQGRETSLLTEQMSELGNEVIHAQEAVAVARARLDAAASINPNALGLQQDMRAAEAKERSLSRNLDALRAQSSTGTESEIELRALQQEADADRALYDRLLARAKETHIQSGLQQADAKIVSRAEWPQAPSFPKKSVILPAVFVASCLVAALLVLAVESLDQGFSTLEQLEAALGFPALGLIPLLKRREARRRAPERHVLDRPNSPFGEAIRNLHTGLMLTGIERAPKVILMTSALPGEGKTAVSLSMARMMASCGKRVVIVDCDLRRPSLHKALNTPRGPGLTDCLKKSAELEDVLVGDPLSGAHVLPAGTLGNTAPDLFASPAMRRLVGQLSDLYDLVVLDCAPVLAVSDTRHLCRLADQTVFIVRWQETRCQAAAAALRQVVSAGGRVGGLLLSMVDLDQYSRYSTLGVTQRRIGLYLTQ